MKHMSIVLIALLACAFGIYFFLVRGTNVEDRSGFDVVHWPPSTAEICRLAETNGTDPDTPAGQAARARYTTLFKKRYRSHTPIMAVGLRFPRSGRLDLMVPARMEPWNMDRLAVNTEREVREAFGHSFDIDLFITYIGAPPLKIGELRPSAGSSDSLQIEHYTRAVHIPERASVAIRK